jgi:hypothetical protein
VGEGVFGNSLLLLNFPVNLKLVKISLYIRQNQNQISNYFFHPRNIKDS